MPYTPCMKGTSVQIKNMYKNSSVVIRFEIWLRLFGTFEKLAPGLIQLRNGF